MEQQAGNPCVKDSQEKENTDMKRKAIGVQAKMQSCVEKRGKANEEKRM